MAATSGIDGLDELRRVLRKLDDGGDMARRLQGYLKHAADAVVPEAQRRAPVGTRPIPKGRRPRKRMRDTVTSFTRGSVAGIRAGALAPGGYAYPKRIEFDPRGTPFMRDALEAKTPEVERRVAEMLDTIAREWSDTV